MPNRTPAEIVAEHQALAAGAFSPLPETRIEQAGADPSPKSGNNPRETMTIETKELLIEAHIPLPEDYLEEVEVAAKVKAAADTFRQGLTEALGDGIAKVFVTRATPKPQRAPRAPRSDAGQPRGRRASANGAAAATATA